MAHTVTFDLPRRVLGKQDVVFEVFEDGELLGKLKVSKGAVVWNPAWGKRGYRVSWTTFDSLMKERGRKGIY